MGAAAQVLEVAFAVQAHVFIAGDAGNDLGLVVLAQALEIGHGFVARQHAALHRLVLGGEFGHALLDRRQILGRERALVGEVVEEAVLDHRADGDLGIGKQLLDRIGQQVGGRVTDHIQTIGILGGDDGQLGVLLYQVAGVDDLGGVTAADLAGQRGLGQARAYRSGNIGHGDRAGILALGTIGERDVDHGDSLSNLVLGWGARPCRKNKKRGTGPRLRGKKSKSRAGANSRPNGRRTSPWK